MKFHAFLPLVTYPEAVDDVAVSAAVAMAAKIEARLHAVAINADIPNVSNPLSKYLLDTSQLILQAEAESRKHGERLLGLVKEKAPAAGIEASTDAVTAPIAALGDVAAMHARYFDIGLVPWSATNETTRLTAEAVVFGAGRPTLVLPENSIASPLDHIAIAWDGSRVAARAVADAGHLLGRASKISVLTVYDEKPIREKDAAERLAAGLRDHGLPAEAVTVSAEDCPIAETLQQAALERDCGLLVMGGYGHSRLRDFVLGGATAGVLTDLRLPVLLSH
ncbi:MAG: universal stress protein [Mesorhizobium sp.]